MTDLFLCVDPGASQTKIIYQLEDELSPNYLLMPSDVESIKKSTLDFYFASKGWIGCPSSIQQAWLQVNDEIFVVGAFASSFDPEDRLQELKYENAMYKVLAAIGIIQEQYELNAKKILVELAVLLPANEYGDRLRFEEKLTQFMSNFAFRGVQIKAKLKQSLIRPEGAGLAAISISRNGIEWFQERKIGVLMLGHRNVSGLYFEYGDTKVYDSPLNGFSRFLDLIIATTSGLNRKKIVSAIFQSLDAARNSIYINQMNLDKSTGFTQHPNWKEYQPIQNLATAKNSDLRQQEIATITNSIDIAISQYWSKVAMWMDKIFADDLDVVIISGGAARFLEPELESYFNCEPIYGYDSSLGKRERDCYFRSGKYKSREGKDSFVPIIWGTEQEQDIKDILNLKESEQSLNYRLIDAFGLFEQLIGKNYSSLLADSLKEAEVG